MKAVVVYESMYGNTHQVADAIGRGLAGSGEVVVVPVAQAAPALVTNADLVVVGGIARQLHQHGFGQVAEPESFLVDKDNHLEAGEKERAEEWGARLAAAVTRR